MEKIESGTINKEDFKKINPSNIMIDSKSAQAIFKKLGVKSQDIDFKTHVIYIHTIDSNHPHKDRYSSLIKAHYTKDGKYLYVQVLCMLKNQKVSDELVDPEEVAFQAVPSRC